MKNGTFTLDKTHVRIYTHCIIAVKRYNMTNEKKERKELLITGVSLPESTGFFAERERRLKDPEQLTLLSDIFMSVVLSDLKACRHVIRILMSDPTIELGSVRTQYVISKVISRGARLDVLAEDKKGVIYHLEIEGADVVDHARRTRFYGSVTDGEFLRKGRDYSELPERYIFYISRTDIWKGGYTVYEEENRFRQTGKKHNDGSHLIYVNAEIDDGSRIAKLMKYFKTADPFDDSEGELSNRVRFLKTEEGGIEIMCEIMEKIREEGKREGRESGMLESHKKTAWNLEKMGMPLDSIAKVVEEDISVVRRWLKPAK